MTSSFASSDIIARGSTYYGGTVPDTANLGITVQQEGTVRIFKNAAASDATNPKVRDGSSVTCILVRNWSTGSVNLLPKRLVAWAAGYRKRRVDSYARTAGAEIAGVVDEFLPAAGVVYGDLFWIVVEGQSLVQTGLAGDGTNSFAEGRLLMALTAATSQATTSGRAGAIDFSGSATTLGNIIENQIGRAMTAMTTSQTATDVLVDVRLNS